MKPSQRQKIAFARHQPLANLQKRHQPLAVGAGADADLGEAAGERGGRGHAGGERLDAIGQRRVRADPGKKRPVRRRLFVGRRVEIVAERRPQRRLVAALDRDGVDDGRKFAPRHRAQQIGEGARLRLELLGGALGFGERTARARLRLARLRMALLGGERRLLGRLERLGAFGGGFGALFVLGVLEAGRAQRGELALDLGIFGLEPGKAPALLRRRRAQRMAARVEVGGGGLRLGELGFGVREPRFRGLFAFARLSGDLAGGVEGLGERRILMGEPLDHPGGVGDEGLLALKVAGELGGATLELGLALAGALFLGLQRVARQRDAVEGRAAARLLLAQRGKIGGGERLQSRRLALGAGALGDVEQIGIELLPGLGEGGLVLPPRDEVGERLVAADVGGEIPVTARLAGLAFQALDLDVDLLQDVLDPQEVVLGPFQAKLRLVAARMQAGNAGRLLEDESSRLGLGRDDLADLALADERGRAGAGGGVGEQELHVARAHLLAVDPIGRARLPLDAAGDLDRLVVVEGGRRAAVGIVEQKPDLGDVARRPLAGAGEDDVVHARAAHGLERALAHHPAQGLDQVRLAAAVRADDAGQARLDLELGGVAEALEAGQAQALEFHRGDLVLRRPAGDSRRPARP